MKKTVFFLLALIFCGYSAYAMDLDGVKQHFLKSEWKDAIREGETLLAGASRDSAGLDQLYYYIGLCYFKDGQFLHSADIFDIILKEFPKSSFVEQAMRASIESYGSAADYETAYRRSGEFLKAYPQSSLVHDVTGRMLFYKQKIGKSGKTGIAVHLQPVSEVEPDLVLADDVLLGKGKAVNSKSFWIQVGAFSSDTNANNLVYKLRAVSYEAGVLQSQSKGKVIYKVRVGPYNTRLEAQAVSKKLSQQGYPTKIVL